MFTLFDLDGNGTIDAHEIMSAMKSIGEEITFEQAKEMLREVDK